MSAKSSPGDGQRGKGRKGMPVGEQHRSAFAVVRDVARGVRGLRSR
jgi:hypothetical protein